MLKREDVVVYLNEQFKNSIVQFKICSDMLYNIEISLKEDELADSNYIRLKDSAYQKIDDVLKAFGVTEEVDFNNTGNMMWSIGSWE